MEIQVHIERLILEGVNVQPGQHALLQAALETELARLLAEGGLSPQLTGGGVLPRLPAGELRLTSASPGAGPEPAQLGHQIAQSIYRGLGR